MREIASLWIGDSLGDIEQASIQSFLKQGHQFNLYCYNKINNIPKGAIIKDAQDILPNNQIIYHKKTGSPALHSDLFRYALMEKTDNIWVDLDIIALKKFDFDSEWIIGFESANAIGSAVLRLPQSSKALQEAQKLNRLTKGLPPTLNSSQKIRYFFKSIYYGGLTIEQWPYGSTGPDLLTYHMEHHNEISHVFPQKTFYSIDLENIRDILLPHALTMDSLPDEAYAIHLWGQQLRKCLRNSFDNTPPAHSLLAEILSLYKE